MNKVLNMTYASSLTNLCEINSSFDTGVLRICYTGQNRNNSYISREAIERNIQTIYNCPIVCNYDRESNTLGGHDMEVVSDGDGNLHLINNTQPVGVIPESADIWFETFKDEDGVTREYLYADVLLWKRQEAYTKIKNDGITAHSMEITVTDGSSMDGIYHINEFEFTAFALIGVEPCFENSVLEVFSQVDYKQQLAEMMQDLKETFTMVNTSKEDDNIHPQTTEGGNGTLNEKMDLIAKYGIDIDSLDFSLDDFTVEELEAKFSAMQEAASEENTDDAFALLSNVMDEIQKQLDSIEHIQSEWGEHSRYIYVDCDMDLQEVSCWDSTDWLLYGFTYQINGDNVQIDVNSKSRKKYVIADFDEGLQDSDTQSSPVSEVFKMMEQKIKDGIEIEKKYQESSDRMSEMELALNELIQYKANVEETEFQNKREEIFSQFEDLSGIEEFSTLRKNCADYDLETLQEKCYAIRGKNGTKAKFSIEEKTPKLKVDKTNEKQDKPYGGLFEKYLAESSN